MGVIRNNNEISIEFTPWTDKLGRIVRLQMVEQLGGEIPRGEVDMFVAGNEEEIKKLITDQKTGTIHIIDEKENGLEYKTDVYITDREFYENSLKLKFICTKDMNFYVKRITTYYKMGIKEAIEALFPDTPDRKEFRIEPANPEEKIWYQNDETNYDICKRLCYAYKKDSIFHFGWDGLMIKDLCGIKDSKGNVEPKMRMEVDRLATQTCTYDLNYNKSVNSFVYSAWDETSEKQSTTLAQDYSEFMSKNAKVSMNYKSYHVLGIDTYDYMKVAWDNLELMKNKGYTNLKVVYSDMPHYKLGDVVIYNRALQNEDNEILPWEDYLVTSNELFFSVDGNKQMDENGMRFSWTSNLYGLQEGKWSADPEDS